MSDVMEIMAPDLSKIIELSKQNLKYQIQVYNVLGYGAKGVPNDDTNAIQKAINTAISDGSKSVFFPPNAYSASDLTGLYQVNLIGDNATLTVGGNPVKLEPFGETNTLADTAAIYNKAIQDIEVLPRGAMSAARRAVEVGTLKVAFWGDSITDAQGGDVNDLNDKYAYRVEAGIRQALPNVTVTVQNYGLGMRTLSEAVDPAYVGLPTDPPDPTLGFNRSPWTIVGKSWRDHVRDFAPDLLIIAFGMNDSPTSPGRDEAFYNNLAAFKSYMATWAKIPSVVLVPTFVPTTDTSRYSQRVDITNSVARATREFAKVNGYNIADANRLYYILRFGKDEISIANDSEFNFYGFPTKWSGNTSSFTLNGNTLTATATNKNVTRNRNFFNGFIQVDMNPSVSGTNGLGRIEYRSSILLGSMVLLIFPGASGTGRVELYSTITQVGATTGLTIPVGSPTTVKIVADGINHQVYLNGTLVLTVATPKTLNDGYVSFGGDNTVPAYSNVQIGYRDATKGNPIYNEDELLGPVNNVQKDGNGINHPTGFGHALFYYPAFFGIIKSLSRTNDNAALLLPKQIASGGWTVSPGGAYPTTTTAGEKLYYCIFPKYNALKGIAFRNLSSYFYYPMSTTAISQATLANLEIGKFAYYNSDATNDLLWISVPATVTFNSELWTYQ